MERLNSFYSYNDRRPKQEVFIEKFKQEHGDDGYDFSKTEYLNCIKEVTITCKTHGDFRGTADNLKRKGCPECFRVKTINKIDEMLEDQGSTFRVVKEEFSLGNHPIKLICKETGDIIANTRAKIIHGWKKTKKEEDNSKLSNNKQIIKRVWDLVNKNKEFKKNNEIQECDHYFSFTCKKHNNKSTISYNTLSEKKSFDIFILKFCKNCRLENIRKKKFIEKIEYINSKFVKSTLDFSDTYLETESTRTIIKNIYCKEHDYYFDCDWDVFHWKKQFCCSLCDNNKKNIFNILCDKICNKLLDEWDFERNTETPEDWNLNYNEKLNWVCKICDERYQIDLERKLNNVNSCPKCNLGTSSKIERLIFYYISKVFENSKNNEFYYLSEFGNKKISYDIMIFDLEPHLIIEYDGEYFHDGVKFFFDTQKTFGIVQSGLKCLRIRENELELIQEHDIKYNFVTYENKRFEESFKGLLKEIFEYIKSNYSLDNEKINKIDEILNKSLDYKSIPNDYFIFPYVEKNLEQRYPEILINWSYEKNKLKPNQISAKSTLGYNWNCKCGKTYKSTIKTQIKRISEDNLNCKNCSQKITSFLEKKMDMYIRIAKEINNNLDNLKFRKFLKKHLGKEFKEMNSYDIAELLISFEFDPKTSNEITCHDVMCEDCNEKINENILLPIKRFRFYDKMLCKICYNKIKLLEETKFKIKTCSSCGNTRRLKLKYYKIITKKNKVYKCVNCRNIERRKLDINEYPNPKWFEEYISKKNSSNQT